MFRGKVDEADQVGEVALGAGFDFVFLLALAEVGEGLRLFGVQQLGDLLLEAAFGAGGLFDDFGRAFAAALEVAEAVAAVGQQDFHGGLLFGAEAECFGDAQQAGLFGALGGVLEAPLEGDLGGDAFGVRLLVLDRRVVTAALEDQRAGFAVAGLRGVGAGRPRGVSFGGRLGLDGRRGGLEQPTAGETEQGGGGKDEGAGIHAAGRWKAPPAGGFVGIRLRGSP